MTTDNKNDLICDTCTWGTKCTNEDKEEVKDNDNNCEYYDYLKVSNGRGSYTYDDAEDRQVDRLIEKGRKEYNSEYNTYIRDWN